MQKYTKIKQAALWFWYPKNDNKCYLLLSLNMMIKVKYE